MPKGTHKPGRRGETARPLKKGKPVATSAQATLEDLKKFQEQLAVRAPEEVVSAPPFEVATPGDIARIQQGLLPPENPPEWSRVQPPGRPFGSTEERLAALKALGEKGLSVAQARIDQAADIAVKKGHVSASILQKAMKVSEQEARVLLSSLIGRGYVSREPDKRGKYKALFSAEEWKQMAAAAEAPPEGISAPRVGRPVPPGVVIGEKEAKNLAAAELKALRARQVAAIERANAVLRPLGFKQLRDTVSYLAANFPNSYLAQHVLGVDWGARGGRAANALYGEISKYLQSFGIRPDDADELADIFANNAAKFPRPKMPEKVKAVVRLLPGEERILYGTQRAPGLTKAPRGALRPGVGLRGPAPAPVPVPVPAPAPAPVPAPAPASVPGDLGAHPRRPGGMTRDLAGPAAPRPPAPAPVPFLPPAMSRPPAPIPAAPPLRGMTWGSPGLAAPSSVAAILQEAETTTAGMTLEEVRRRAARAEAGTRSPPPLGWGHRVSPVRIPLEEAKKIAARAEAAVRPPPPGPGLPLSGPGVTPPPKGGLGWLGKLGLAADVYFGLHAAGNVMDVLSGRDLERKREERDALRREEEHQARVQELAYRKEMLLKTHDPGLVQIMMGLPETTDSEVVVGGRPDVERMRRVIRADVASQESKRAMQAFDSMSGMR